MYPPTPGYHNTSLQNISCQRSVVKDGKCILHVDDPEKDMNLFLKELENILHSQESFYDYNEIVFPNTKKEFYFPNSLNNRPSYFLKSKFYCDVSFKDRKFTHIYFSGARFLGSVKFNSYPQTVENERTRFTGTTIFNEVIFRSSVDFDWVIFQQNPSFKKTKFRNTVNFNNTIFVHRDNQNIFEFDQTEFSDTASFKMEGPKSAKELNFRNCYVQGVDFTSLSLKEEKVTFDNIEEWYKPKRTRQWYKRYIFRVKRNGISYEDDKDIDSVKLVDIYKYLENYFYDNSNFPLASQFYIGQMIGQRRNREYSSFSSFLNHLYQFFSNYGESIFRPLITMFALWIVVAFIFLFHGIPLTDNNNTDSMYNVNYDININCSSEEFQSGFIDYFRVLGSSIASVVSVRRHELSPPSDSWQRMVQIIEQIFTLLFISFIIIAAKRKFIPKKPTGT